MAGPREHHFWPPQGLSAPVAKDMENMPGKLLGARASSGTAGKIRHNWSKIENFIEVKSNRAAELSPTAGAQPAAHRGTKKGAGVSWGTGGTAGGGVGGPHPRGPRKKAKPQALAPHLPPWLVKDRGAKAETWCKLLSGQTARERGSYKLRAQPTTSWLSSKLQCTPASSQDLPLPCPARREPPGDTKSSDPTAAETPVPLSPSPQHSPSPATRTGHSPAPGSVDPLQQSHSSCPALALREAQISPRWLWQRARAWGKPEPEPGKKAELCSSTQPHLPGQPQRAQSSL